MADTNETGGPKPMHSAGEDLERLKERAQEEARAAAEELAAARETAASAVGQAREEAARRGHELKERTAEQLRSFAETIRQASDDLAEQQPGIVSDLVRGAAHGLEGFSTSLRHSTARDMVEGVRDFGRQNPVAFLAGSMLAGFAIARFATSSSSEARPGATEDYGRTESHGTTPGYAGSGTQPSSYGSRELEGSYAGSGERTGPANPTGGL